MNETLKLDIGRTITPIHLGLGDAQLQNTICVDKRPDHRRGNPRSPPRLPAEAARYPADVSEYQASS